MKKRNMIVCTLLSISLAANLVVPAMASDTAAQSTENTAPPELPNGEAPSTDFWSSLILPA